MCCEHSGNNLESWYWCTIIIKRKCSQLTQSLPLSWTSLLPPLSLVLLCQYFLWAFSDLSGFFYFLWTATLLLIVKTHVKSLEVFLLYNTIQLLGRFVLLWLKENVFFHNPDHLFQILSQDLHQGSILLHLCGWCSFVSQESTGSRETCGMRVECPGDTLKEKGINI